MSRTVRAAAPLLCLLPLALQAAQPPLQWADFQEPRQGLGGARVQPIAMSEKPGDALAGTLRIADAALQVEGRLSRAHGSQWATLGIEVGSASHATVDLSGYRSIGIRLASALPQVLRIRLKGQDRATLEAGCYPVVMQRVGPQMTHYVIPLSAFGPEPYCGPRGASTQQTLPSVAQVEVTANEPSAEPVRFAVGRIEFLRDDAEPAAPAASAMPAAAGPRWTLVWADEFNAPAGHGVDPARWQLAKGLQPTADVQHDGQGHLVLAPRCSGGPCTPGARLQASPAGAMLYGRIEIRYKAPEVPGLSASLSLQGAPLTQLPWPDAGEIVLIETHGRRAEASTGLHAPGIDDDTYRGSVPPGPAGGAPDGFHVAALEWDPQQLRWLLDEVQVKTLPRAELPERARAAFDTWPFLPQLALRVGAEGAGAVPGRLPDDARLLVDYVRVFQRDDLAAAVRPRLAVWQAQRSALAANAGPAAPAPAREPPRRRTAAVDAPPSQPVRQVICERNSRYGLMMCY